MFGADPLGEEFKIDESDFVHGLPKIMNGWLHLAETIMTKPPKPANFDRNIERHDLMKKFCAVSELANKLQQKIKTYKLQIEEAEEIAALNLAKFRKAQQELEETEDRAKMAENSISDVSMNRSFF